MRIVKLSSLSEKERKKVLEEQEERYAKNQQERQQLQKQANDDFVKRFGNKNTEQKQATQKNASTVNTASKLMSLNNNPLAKATTERRSVIGNLTTNNKISTWNQIQNFAQNGLINNMANTVQQTTNNTTNNITNNAINNTTNTTNNEKKNNTTKINKKQITQSAQNLINDINIRTQTDWTPEKMKSRTVQKAQQISYVQEAVNQGIYSKEVGDLVLKYMEENPISKKLEPKDLTEFNKGVNNWLNQNANQIESPEDFNTVAESKKPKLEEAHKTGLFKGSEAYKDDKNLWDNIVSTVQTAGATVGDVGLNVVKGLGNVAEGVGDLALYGVAQVQDWAGNKQGARNNREFAKKNVISDWMQPAIDWADKNSVIGDFGDTVNQGAGYMAGLWASAGAGGDLGGAIGGTEKAVKVGSKVGELGTMISTAFGNGMTEAYNKGATNKQAWVAGATSALTETLSEEMFGFFGNADTKLVNKIASKMQTGLGKTFTRLEMAGLGEASEEFISYAGNYMFNKIIQNTVDKDKNIDLAGEWDWNQIAEEAGSAFLTATLMGGAQTKLAVSEGKANGLTTTQALNQYATNLDIQGVQEDIEDLQKDLQKENNLAKRKDIKQQIEWKKQQLMSLENKNTNQQNKTPQNGFSQAEKTETLRQQARNKLESIKQNYDENSYNQMQEFIETAPSEKALNQVIEDLNKETKQVAPLKQKQEVQLPMKQQTENKSFEDVVSESMNNYEDTTPQSPMQDRNINTIGKETNKNAYQYDNPKVKPYFQDMAQQMGEDLAYISSSDNRSTQKGGGTKLSTTTKAMDILHNEQGYSYDQIAKGLQNIIDDKGSENNAISKKIELVIDEQLRNGYTNALGKNIEPNQEYINIIQQNQTLQEQKSKNNENIINNQEQNLNNNTTEKYETVHLDNGKEYQRKEVRAFKDNDGNEFRLYELPNHHNELSIKETGKNQIKVIRGSRNEILKEIQKYWKGQGTFSDLVQKNQKIKKNAQQINELGGEILSKETRNNFKMQNVAVIENKKDLVNKVEKALRQEDKQTNFTIGGIKQKTIDRIKSDINSNIFKERQYSMIVNDDDIIHISKHFNTSEEIAEEIIRLLDIVDNYDTVNLKQEGTEKKLIFEKAYPHADIRSVELVSNNKNSLNLVTVYYTKKRGQFNQSVTSNLNGNSRLESTSFSNNSISQNEQNVKSENTNTNNMQNNQENIQKTKLPMKEKQEVKAPIKQIQENTQNTKGEAINWNEIERPENNQKFRKHYRSIIESSNTTAEAKAIAKELMGTDTYEPETNKGQLAQADQRIMTSSPETELQSLLSRAMNGEKISSVDIAVGERLIQYFSKTGSKQQLQEAIQATAMAGTSAGQTVQALSMLNHQTPQGQATWIQRSVDKMNQQLAKRKGGTITTDADGNVKVINKQGLDITDKVDLFNLTPEMTEKIVNSENQEQMWKNIDEVYEELGQQVPKSMLEKIDTWRYFSMLANIRTHARNMIGNFAMGKMQRAKDILAGGIEDVASKFNPNMERTKTLRKADTKTKEFAKNDFKNADVQLMLELNENKYNPQSRLQNARKTFKNNTLENTLGKLFNLNDKLLEAEDGIGLKAGYQKALSDYLTANKIDVDNITDAQLSKARNYAIQQAKEATFHQANAIASAITQFENKNLATKLFTNAILPFKKTPMNIAKSGIEYSPLQIAKSATIDLHNLRTGKISINQYIDNISKGVTGTGIALIGYALANAGILKASGDEDKDKEKYEEEQGKQSYSIQLGGKTYSLDWLAPTGIPLFVGAETFKLFNQESKEKNTEKTSEEDRLNQAIKGATNLLNAGATAINPMSEMSMISGLTSALSSYNTSDNLGSLGNILTNSGKSYINQFVPTALGQLAKTTDEYERSTKSTAKGTLGKALDQTANQIKAKIPGLRQTLPIKTDIWGKEQKQEASLPLRALNNFINPATVKTVSTDSVDKELNKLYDVNKESAVLPDVLNKTVQLNGQTYRLSNKEYSEFTKNYGQNSYNLIKDFIKTSDYKNLTQEQKENAINNIYSYAKEKNKLEYAKKVNEEVKPSTLYSTMEEIQKGGGKQSEYLNYLSKTKGISKESEKNEILANANYSNKTKEIIYANGTGKDDDLYNNLLSKSNIDMTEYLDYKTAYSNGKFLADKDKNGKAITGTGKAKVINYLNNNISGAGNRLLIAGKSYVLQNSEKQKLAQYINQIATTREERIELYKQLDKNFTVQNGNVYMKVSK